MEPWVFGNLESMIEKKKLEIEVLDRTDDTMGLEVEDIIKRKRISTELIREMQWRE